LGHNVEVIDPKNRGGRPLQRLLERSRESQRGKTMVAGISKIATMIPMDIIPTGNITRIVLTARPIAFVVFVIYAGPWIAFAERFSDWHSIATLATWAMTLFIQRAEHRDIQAIHAKLDEVLKTQGNAENDLMDLDDLDAEEVEATR
jgi:hypothetical protein